MTKRENGKAKAVMNVLAAAGLAAALVFAGEQAASAAGGEEQIACREMIEGWYGGNASKLDELLYPTFAKQGVIERPAPEKTATLLMNKEEFIKAVASGSGKLPENQWDITVETMDLSELLATVKVTSAHLVDVCQLGKVDGEWKIFNVIWTIRKKPAQGN